jgi:phosphoribosylglycinamide formyltransferase 1
MVSKIKTCVFISGNGSNLKSIIKSSRDYTFPAKIDLVISNNINSNGLLIGKKNGIPSRYIKYVNQFDFERKAINELRKKDIKFLILAGFMKVLSKKFIYNFRYKIVNIHPSLLPKFKGLNTHKRVLKDKEKYSGCTVHFVSDSLDSGQIISQKKILINKNETEDSLKNKVLKLEHRLYSQSIISIFR